MVVDEEADKVVIEVAEMVVDEVVNMEVNKMAHIVAAMPWKKFQILFRNLQVINWHKYKDSTNKNGHRRMVLAEQAARIFPIFDINKDF